MILVCGDAMVDRYWFGEVSRISPEAPVPVVKMGRVEERAGAAANVAANVRSMGGGCETLFSASAKPVVKTRVIGRSQQVVRVDFDEPQAAVDPIAFLGKLNGVDIVVFSDYGKGALSGVADLIEISRRAGAKVLVDPKGHDYQRYRGADVIKPNLDEMREMVGGWGDEAQLHEKAQRLRAECGVEAILLTRSGEGMTLFEADGTVTSIHSEAREVYDVSGAGDTAIAAFAVALERGCDLKVAAVYANKAAGVAVGRFGTAVVTESEVFG